MKPYNRSVLEMRTPYGTFGRPDAHFEKWRLNHHGLRGPDLGPKQPGEIRVVAMGASDTFGLHEPEGQEWPAQLNRLVQAEYGRSVHVINGAFYGLKLPGTTAYLKERILPLQPDIVILYVSLLHRAFFTGDNAKGAGRLDRTEGPESGAKIAGFEWRMARKIKEKFKEILPAGWLYRWNVEHFRKKIERIRSRGQVQVTSVVDERLFQETAGDLEEFIWFAQERGIRVILTSHLNNTTDEWGLLNFQFLLPAFEPDTIRQILDRMNQVTAQKAREHGLAFVDVAARVKPGAPRMADHVHLTGEGAQLVAQALMPELKTVVETLGPEKP